MSWWRDPLSLIRPPAVVVKPRVAMAVPLASPRDRRADLTRQMGCAKMKKKNKNEFRIRPCSFPGDYLERSGSGQTVLSGNIILRSVTPRTPTSLTHTCPQRPMNGDCISSLPAEAGGRRGAPEAGVAAFSTSSLPMSGCRREHPHGPTGPAAGYRLSSRREGAEPAVARTPE